MNGSSLPPAGCCPIKLALLRSSFGTSRAKGSKLTLPPLAKRLFIKSLTACQDRRKPQRCKSYFYGPGEPELKRMFPTKRKTQRLVLATPVGLFDPLENFSAANQLERAYCPRIEMFTSMPNSTIFVLPLSLLWVLPMVKCEPPRTRVLNE